MMNTRIFILGKDKLSARFQCEGNTGEFELINCLIPELNGIPKVEWLDVLNRYILEVKYRFNSGTPEVNNVSFISALLPVHDHPIFYFNAKILFGETGEKGINTIEISIKTHNGSKIEPTFQFSYCKSPTIKELPNHAAVGIGLSEN